ncbi:MAG TPA: N-acetylmuramoyl-L-alanine amidase [Chthoniobacterales bacterium]|nr:N-acetylmuramoyl-L-alanine amidase [Chthoniobacterales bacterium]
MSEGQSGLGGAMKNIVVWLGLALMIASFVWWQLLLSPRQTASYGRANAPAPFTLVVLDPGHGGQDSGAICGAIYEKDLTLDIAQRVDHLLQAQGLATLMTRVGDSYVSLQDRAAVTNRARDCIFVSIHFNESKKPVSGIETYYAEHQTAPAPRLVSWIPFFQGPAAESPTLASQSLARFIQEAMIARTKAPDRGTKAEQFFVIDHVSAPAVLVEGGFLNKEEIAKLATNDYRDQMAAAISEGILRYRDVLKERQLTLAVSEPHPE